MEVELNVSEQLRERKAEEVERLSALIEAYNSRLEDCTGVDGYTVTPEQCNKINAGDKEAVAQFFKENKYRLESLARAFLRRVGVPLRWDKAKKRFEPAILEISDCLNQLYIDMLQGLLKFVPVKGVFSSIIAHSFRYCGVGGFGDEDGAYISKKVKEIVA